jgi:magnesium-transporting ATPase (P-type)
MEARKSRVRKATTMDYQPGLKAILDSSTLLVNWALALFAGSAAAIVSTSFERPKKQLTRLFYLLFPVAWCFLGSSLWAAQDISRRYVAAQFSHDSENLRNILSKINGDYLRQWQMLAIGLLFLCAWLLWFVVWWIWCAPDKIKKRESTYDVN